MRSMFPEASTKAKTVEKEKENIHNNVYRKSTSALKLCKDRDLGGAPYAILWYTNDHRLK